MCIVTSSWIFLKSQRISGTCYNTLTHHLIERGDNMSVSINLTFEQLAQPIQKLKPGERETLAIMLDLSLRRKIDTRRRLLARERKQRNLLTEKQLFEK